MFNYIEVKCEFKMEKKAQIQMGETIFVIMIIILLIVMGFVFMFKGEESSILKQATKFHELDSIALGQLITNLPELVCSTSGTKQQSCFDKSKIDAFGTILRNNSDISMEYYFEKLGNVNITVEQIYPENGYVQEIYVNNFELDANADISGLIMSYGSTLKIPIILRDPTTNENAFGVLYVTKYRRKWEKKHKWI